MDRTTTAEASNQLLSIVLQSNDEIVKATRNLVETEVSCALVTLRKGSYASYALKTFLVRQM